MTDPVDEMGPWTIKSVPRRTTEIVKTAAMKEGLTVGQWLERRVREWSDDGGSVRVSDQGRPTVIELAQLAAALSGGRETAVVRAARSAVLALLQPHVPVTPGRKPRQTAVVSLDQKPGLTKADQIGVDEKRRIAGPGRTKSET